MTADGTGLNAPGSQQRADLVKPIKILGGHGANPYFDPTSFQPVPNTEARFGTASFNDVYGPGAANLDLSLFRTFILHNHWASAVPCGLAEPDQYAAFFESASYVSSVEYGTDNAGNQNYSNIVNLNGFGQITSTSPGNS